MKSGETSFLQPRVLIPFVTITLIWGSTWIVITAQLGRVPPIWSVAYRFALGAVAMAAYAALRGESLRIGRNGHVLALLFGIPQFTLNYTLVYAAEGHITSGLVAVLFALLLVPNSLLGWLVLKQRLSGGFLFGSAVALAGVGLLFLHEFRAGGAPPGHIAAGIGLTLLAVLAASVSNIMQASERLKRRPIAPMIAWGMAYSVLADIVVAWAVSGPPVLDPRPSYWIGLLYLSVVASALSFALYYHVIRSIGPARAAYSSVLIPVLAMGFSTIFEHYRWSPTAAAGGIVTLAGLLVALRSRRPPVPAPEG